MSADEITEIRLELRPGMSGRGDNYLLKLHSDGTASFAGQRACSFAKPRRISFTDQDFQRLAAEVERLDFFSLKGGYSVEYTCQASAVMTVVRGGVEKRVGDYGGAGPASLHDLMATVSGVLVQWDWEPEEIPF